MKAYESDLEKAGRELETIMELLGNLEGRISDVRLDRVAPAADYAAARVGGAKAGEAPPRWYRINDGLANAYGYLNDAEFHIEQVIDMLGYAQAYVYDAAERLRG